MQVVEVHRVPTGSPDDVSGLQSLLDSGRLRAGEVRAVMGKTEGNGCVNDFTRGFALRAVGDVLAPAAGGRAGPHFACVMSGGTEGVMSPHLTVFASREDDRPPVTSDGHQSHDGKRLALGTSSTRRILPEELGRGAMITATAKAVEAAVAEAGIDDPRDVHYVQVKCPLLTPERISDAGTRGESVVTTDTYQSMAYSRGAAALGIALALGEIAMVDIDDSRVLRDGSLYSGVASASAGVELENVEILVLGNSARAGGELMIGHAVMRDAIDGRAVRDALRSVGVHLEDGEVPPSEAPRVVNVFAKAEADESGRVRNRRHTMLGDSDIHSTRHARAAVSAVIASIVGDPMVYVSGGAEHQGPPGGGPVAVIARAG